MRTINDVMVMKIRDLDFSVRVTNCLSTANIKTLGELTKLKSEDLSVIRNMGKTSLSQIEEKLKEMDLTFNMTDYDWLIWGVDHIQWIKIH